MQNIIRLFAKYGSLITFILLQAICFFIIVNYNQSQRSIFINSSKLYNNKLANNSGKLYRYLSLDEVNDSLATYNATLLELYINRKEDQPDFQDTAMLQYQLTPANVVNSTYQLRNNHLTLDKGRNEGIQPDMGVISQKGLVGIVRNVSDNFAHVISILNAQTRISATIKPYAYPGTIVWQVTDPSTVTLEAIPKHADIAEGDTVITSGYSTIFPKGIAIGVVKEFAINRGSSNYDIAVQLFNDVPNEKIVYVVKNILGEEQQTLESEVDE